MFQSAVFVADATLSGLLLNAADIDAMSPDQAVIHAVDIMERLLPGEPIASRTILRRANAFMLRRDHARYLTLVCRSLRLKQSHVPPFHGLIIAPLMHAVNHLYDCVSASDSSASEPNPSGPLLLSSVVRRHTAVLLKYFWSRAKNTLSRATAGHFISSRAKCTYLPCYLTCTANLSRAFFFRPRAIHGPRAPI